MQHCGASDTTPKANNRHTASAVRSPPWPTASGLFRAEVVEVQLAHKHGDATRLAYDRGDFLEERNQLMNWWASQCDQMRQGAEVIELSSAA